MFLLNFEWLASSLLRQIIFFEIWCSHNYVLCHIVDLVNPKGDNQIGDIETSLINKILALSLICCLSFFTLKKENGGRS